MSSQKIDSVVAPPPSVKTMATKHELGQYFTTSVELKQKVCEFILNRPAVILEPSIGQGDLIEYICARNPEIRFDMYEIDTAIRLLDGIIREQVIYGDFMTQSIHQSYHTIVGNPPYVRTTRGNLYIDFIEKCYHLLCENGELIFIVPSDFLKLTSAAPLLDEMMTHGTFTHIYHPHNENLFEHASIDVIVFRYCKNAQLEKKTLYNGKLMYANNTHGFITFSEQMVTDGATFGEYFDVYVGLVSGKDDVYKNAELGNLSVLTGENKKEKFIYLEKYPCEKEEVNTYLLAHKPALLERRIKKFTEKNWFEWGAPRNISSITKHLGEDCIYVYNLTRKSPVAFAGKVDYFGGTLIMLRPKKTCNIEAIVNYLNSHAFTQNFMFSGRFKIGHRQIVNSHLPI